MSLERESSREARVVRCALAPVVDLSFSLYEKEESSWWWRRRFCELLLHNFFYFFAWSLLLSVSSTMGAWIRWKVPSTSRYIIINSFIGPASKAGRRCWQCDRFGN